MRGFTSLSPTQQSTLHPKKRAKVLLFFELCKFFCFFLYFSCLFRKKAVLLHLLS